MSISRCTSGCKPALVGSSLRHQLIRRRHSVCHSFAECSTRFEFPGKKRTKLSAILKQVSLNSGIYINLILFSVAEGSCPSHIIIFCKGRMFRVDVLDAKGDLLTPPELATILSQILKKCENPAEDRVAVLTCDERTKWSQVKQKSSPIFSQTNFLP